MMRGQIGTGEDEASWNRDLVRQLSFIRKHLRYPISRRTAVPVLMLASILPATVLVLYVVFSRQAAGRPGWLPLLLVAMMLLPGIVAARRYLATLRFIAVPAGATVAGNMALLQGFLRHHHFAIGRHPEAPEVFQIMSRRISQLRDEREVVILIADERRILVNSHFTHNRYSLAVGQPHARQIAELLAEWLRQQARAEGESLPAPLS